MVSRFKAASAQSGNTLQQVLAQFTKWRANKKSGAKIPEHLWALVTGLIGQYSQSDITKTLGLSGSQFYQRGLYAKVPPPTQPVKFVNIDLAESMRLPVESVPTQIKLSRGDRQLTICNPTLPQLDLLLQRIGF